MFGSSNSIIQASATVFLITIVSKIIAYIESAIMAAYFGTSADIDMFYLANSISVRFVFTVFAGLSIVGVTMYNNAVTKGGREKGERFVSALLAVVIPVAVVVTVVIILLAPFISSIMTKNYSPYETSILSSYIRALAFVTVFYAACIIFTAVLNANKRFVPGALCGALQNITLIVFIVFLSSKIRVWSVVIGFIAGYAIQGIFLYLCVRKVVTLKRCKVRENIDLKKMALLLVPLILGDATGEINLLVDQFLSTGLGDGYVAALSYSGTLDDFVSSFFIQSVSSVLLPFFSVLAEEKKYAEMSAQIRKVINTMMLILLPVTIVTVFTAREIVSAVYERGNFNVDSVSMTSDALIGYGVGFIFKAIFVITRRPFYAMENTKVPMILSMFSVVVNIMFSIFFSRIWGVFGITFATTVAFFLGDIVAIMIMNRKIPGSDWSGELLFMGKIAIAGVLSGICVFYVSRMFSLTAIMTFLLSTIICFTVYGVCLKLLRTDEFNDIISVKRLRMRKRGNNT